MSRAGCFCGQSSKSYNANGIASDDSSHLCLLTVLRGLGATGVSLNVLSLLILTALEDGKTEEEKSLVHIGTKGAGSNLRHRNMAATLCS